MKEYKKRRKKLNRSYLNYIYYLYRRNSWVLDLKRFFKSYKDVNVESPIFLLGTQGGGLTLLSRMLRRNNSVISVTGNSDYWSGADEMQNVYRSLLPKTLTGIKNKGWLYASNKYVADYRNDRTDVIKKDARSFKKIIRWTIYRHSQTVNQNRFIDKSQMFTVKMSYISELCEGLNPKFVLVSRNPYAMCLRAMKHESFKEITQTDGYEIALTRAAEHWNNSFKFALEDKTTVSNFMSIKFENILLEPKVSLKKICQFCDLKFEDDMIPKKDHKIPFGSTRLSRWYPLRTDVNNKYLKNISYEEKNIINKICGDTAAMLGYE